MVDYANTQLNMRINDAVFFYAFIQIMNLKLLTTLALLALVLSQCPPNYSLPNLTAGSLQFSVNSNSANGIQKYQYTFDTPFATKPNVALALQDFSISSLGPHAFYVAPSQVSGSSIVFNLAYTAPIWTSIRFNFWASVNPEIQLGYFGNVNIANLAKDGSAVVSTNIQQAFGSNDNPVVRAFLNGYEVTSQVVQIAVNPSNLQGTTLSIRINYGKTTQLKSVWVSWIAFSPVTASFTAYGGSVSRNAFTGTFNSDISSNLYQNSYLLYGLTTLSLTGTDPLAYTCQISNNFQLSISSSRNFDSLGLVYIVAGNSPSKLCAACGNNNKAFGNTCLSSCPLGTTANTYKDGGVACLGTAVLTTASINTTTSSTVSSSVSSTTTSQVSPSASSTSTVSTSANIQTPSVVTPTPTVIASNPSSSSNNVKVTCPVNAFFNGIECVCEVGYGYINGQCTALVIASTAIPVIINPTGTSASTSTSSSSSTSSASSSSSSSTSSTSTSSSSTSSTSTSTSSTSTSTSSTSTSTSSTSSSNSSSSSAPAQVQPKPSGSINCPSNSYDNGLGTCVCNSGFYFTSQGCILGSPCPANSTRQTDGSCKCDAGLTNYNGFCSKCPPGALFSSQTNSCIFVCGQNSIYNSSAGSCVCVTGYGLQNGQCQVCPTNYFISNGYCVTCPVNSVLNSATNACDCLAGFFINQNGVCAQKCGTNQVYDSMVQQCRCLDGLARINGACTICPAGTTPAADGSGCSACGQNQQLVGGQCVCNNGYALNANKVCTICSNLPNGFLINGACSVCPSNLVYNGNQGCTCPPGRILQGSTCITQCKSDELLDSQGNCFTCGNNQVISNAKCVCISGFTLNSCGVCVLSCSSNQFVYQGFCATCPLNTVYNSQINGCACPTGYYKDTYGVCQQLVLKPIDCAAGQYFDSNSGCVTCLGSCKTCKSATQCLTCVTSGYSPDSNGVCQPTCGDGLILGGQTCDTGLTYSPGCINCKIQNNWSCSGQPSVCINNTPAPTPAPAPVTPSTPSTPSNNSGSSINSTGISNLAALYQSGTASINSNNVFITLKTNPTFTFLTPTEMQSFIKTEFDSGQKPTVYCSQRQSPNLDTFDCLLIYPSGVPNSPFSIKFSYNYQAKSGSVTVKVDPFAASNSRRGRNDSS